MADIKATVRAPNRLGLLQLMPPPSHTREDKFYKVVVAIDFGTSFSGFAFSFNHKDGSEDIYVNRAWGSAQGYSTLKTPTCILLDQEKRFVKFGYEAAERYAELEDTQDKKFYFFDRFKMMLHVSEETLNRNTCLEARNGKQLRALDVFSKALAFLKEKALDVILDHSGVRCSARDVRWVVTVPAIWKPASKQFMREAAYAAGLASSNDPKQLIIALEPEAAAVYCRQRKLSEFVAGKGEETVKEALVPAKTQYLVIDNGGGTMDITAHEIGEDDDIKEIHPASGEAYGGTKVDEEFKNLLAKVFGEDFMNEFYRTHPSDWLELLNDFEVRKRADRAMKGEVTRIRLPANFLNLLRHENGNDDNDIIRRHYKVEEVKISKDYLCLGSEVVKSLFEPAIASIINHLKIQLQDSNLRGIKILFLVGGFSESRLLQARIRQEFQDKYNILIPLDAQTAIVKGAVMFGKRPQIVVERCLAETYGTKCYCTFNFYEHKRDYLKWIEGEPLCDNIFSVLARKDDIVKIGEWKSASKYHPVRSDQTEILFEFFTSSDQNVLYTTDRGVRKLPGHITVSSPDISKGKNRRIELRLFFETEIKVVGIDLESGNEDSTYIDFLTLNAN